MSSERLWRSGALVILLGTAAGYLASRLVFAPVPWPDGSAFYLPGMELVHWPPRWRMHSQAAFVPSYDEANFNLMPALPLLLGLAGRSGLGHWFHSQVLIRAVSLAALLAWAWLLWDWLSRGLARKLTPPKARLLAAIVALAGLWDPVLRWGTLVVRTETWIGLGWLWILRELAGSRRIWRISWGLAMIAYFHFEAVYLVPAVIVGMGFERGWFRRLVDIGARTTLLLLPWLVYAAAHASLFVEQLQIQFFRLAHGNHWMSGAYLIFHSLFIDHGSPSGNPKLFNVAKGLFWVGLLALSILTIPKLRRLKEADGPRRAILASSVAFAATFYLWATKAEVWFITLCHLVFWPWLASMILDTTRPGIRRALAAISAGYAVFSVAAAVAQERAISPGYSWPVYQEWVDCIERALGPLDAKPGLKLWQPYVPDILVELSGRHPDWDMTRTLDFPARMQQALAAVEKMDAMVFTRFFNPSAAQANSRYLGPLRESDRAKMSNGSELPFGPWALDELSRPRSVTWSARVCETGPFWAAVFTSQGSSR